jgi:hypothetical protein
MMLLIDTSMTLEHARIREAVADIRGHGFDAVCLEFRNCLYDASDEVGRAALRAAAEEARRLGLAVVNIFPAPGRRLLEIDPEARQAWIVEHRATAANGRFRFAIRRPDTDGSHETSPAFETVAKAFVVTRDEDDVILEARDVTAALTYEIVTETDIVLNGRCPLDGELLVYAAYSTGAADYAAPRLGEAIERLLDDCAGLPLDGYALDEFGAGVRAEGSYAAGAAFLRTFGERYGYHFLDKVYLLHHEARNECAGKLRYDYYNLTMETTYRVQELAKNRYAERFGPARFAGFHSTWWGEGNSGDLWAGNLDYFRLTDNLSGGFVDAQYDAERTMLSMTLLAESLAKYSSTGFAYNMCWDRTPTSGKMEYFHRLLAARNVRWVGHAYGRSGPFGPGYPAHPTWADAARCTSLERAFQAFVGTAASRPRVAMMYAWESVACRNDPFMHYHRLSMKALLHKMLLHHIEIDVVPSFEDRLDRYEALIVLWPSMLPEAAWERIRRYAAAGKRLIFIGPPAACTTEGRDVRSEFAALIGAAPDASQGVDERRGVPYSGEYEYVAWDLWFTSERIPMLCFPQAIGADPSRGGPTAEARIVHDGRTLGVRKGNVLYYAFELPLTPYFEPLLHELEAFRDVALPPGTLSKVAYDGDGDGAVLTLMPRWGGLADATFDFAGHRVSIRDGRLIGLRFGGGRVTDAIGEGGATIEVDGEPIAYRVVSENSARSDLFL